MPTINVAIADTFLLRDNANLAITGKIISDFTTMEAYLLTNAATTAAITLNEIGAGEYGIQFTPTVVGTWTSHIVWNSGGVFREFSQTYIVEAAAASTATVSTSVSGSLALTRAQLRTLIADELGDLTSLTATANGSTTTFVDTQRTGTQTETLRGRQILFTSGSNLGTTKIITAFTDTTGTITWSGAITSTVTNDTAEIYNKRGTNWLKEEYDRVINATINEATGHGLIEVVSTIGAAFDMDTPEVTVPAALIEVYAVEWEDTDGIWHKVDRSDKWGHYGWSADPAAGEIRIQGLPARNADGNTIRLYGYGRQATLSADTDTCALDAGWMVARCCYRLMRSGLDRDSSFGQKILLYKEESEKFARRLRIVRNPDTVSVRAI